MRPTQDSYLWHRIRMLETSLDQKNRYICVNIMENRSVVDETSSTKGQIVNNMYGHYSKIKNMSKCYLAMYCVSYRDVNLLNQFSTSA